MKTTLTRTETKISFVLFVLAFAVRASYASLKLWWSSDSDEYLTLARSIAFHHSFSLTTGPTALRPPLYPFLIATVWWTESAPVTVVILVQVICGAATVVLVYLIAGGRFSHRVALLAALGATFAPMTVHYTAVILSETVFTFLITLGFFWWGRNRGVAGGVVFGLAALTRITILPFLGGLLLLSLLPPWRQQRRLYVLIFVSAMMIASVWVIRNAVVFKRFILIQSRSYGVNFFAGTIETQLYGDDVWTKVNKEIISNTDKAQDDADHDRKFVQLAIDRIKKDPSQYLRTRLKQYPRLFLDSGDYLLGSSNVTFSAAIQERRPLVIITKISFMLANIATFASAICGIVLERRRLVSLSHIILFPVFLSLIHLPMWIESRYMLPMMPLVLILAARGIEGLWKYVDGSRASRN